MNLIHLGILVLRISVGGMLLLHGISKLSNGIGFITGQIEEIGLPGFLGYAVFLGEVLGPLMVIVGFWTRLGAMLMFINMLVAILLVHSSSIFSLTETGAWGIETPALFLFASLTLMLTGGGKYSVSRSSPLD